MSQPIVVSDVGGYTFAWEDEQIKITATSVKTHTSDGHISGVLRVETTAPGYKPLLHSPSQFNFMATRSRDELAKRLTVRFKEVDWYAKLERVAEEVIARTIEGEPLETINTADDIKPPPWLLKPLLIEGLPTILFGSKGSCKTTLALAFAQILEFRWQDNPLGLEAPDDPRSVLLLDWENTKNIYAWQAKKLRNGMLDGDYTQHYRRMTRPLAVDIEVVRRLVALAQAEVVVIDSLGPACGGDLNSTQPALDFFSALSSLKVTALILAHTAKTEDGKTRSVFGSSFFENEARNIWEVRSLQEPGEDSLVVGLYHRKPLPFYGRMVPFGYKFLFTDSTTKIATHDPEAVPEFAATQPAHHQILQFIKGTNPVSRSEIIEALPDIPKGTVDSSLNRLVRDGKITKLPGGCYGLLSNRVENA